MGMMPPPEYCHVTGLKTQDYPTKFDLAEYVIQIKGQRILFRFHWNHKNSPIVENNKHVFYGLILNGQFPKEYGNLGSPVLDNIKLESIIQNSVYPKTPEDKIYNLLNYIHSLQEYEGSPIVLDKYDSHYDLIRRLY